MLRHKLNKDGTAGQKGKKKKNKHGCKQLHLRIPK